MTLKNVTLDDKYDLSQSHVFVTGYQALIRACLMQQQRDRRTGINTAGYVSGYRGSPLGTLDTQFMRAKPHLDQHNVLFHSGLNEDLALQLGGMRLAGGVSQGIVEERGARRVHRLSDIQGTAHA